MQKCFLERALNRSLPFFLSVLFALDAPVQADQSLQRPAAAKSTAKSSAASSTTKLKAKAKPGSKLFMWKACSESGAVLYLLGTIHVFKAEYYPLADEMEKAFNKASALLVEINTTKTNPAAVQPILLTKGVYKAPDNLAQHLDPVVCAKLEKFCSDLNLPFEQMKRFKPWFIVIQLTTKGMEKLGFTGKDGIDLHFMNEANAGGKKIIGLETIEFQMNLFADVPDDMQYKWLQMEMDEDEKLPEDAAKMMKAWFEGDDKSLDDLTMQEVKEHPEFAPIQDKILYDRNATLAEKLELYLKGKGTYMCAVGAGHLSGDRSILSILKQKGYQVTQVKVGDEI